MTNNNGLADRLELESWIGTRQTEDELFVVGFRFVGDELSGYELSRAREVPAADRTPETVERRWVWEGVAGETAISVTSLEAPSRQAAHELLVRVLSDFQSPLAARSEDPVAGDLAFSDGSDRWSVFARANVVFVVRNAGDRLVDVGPATRAIDEVVIRRDDLDDGHDIVPTIDELELREATDRARQLVVRAADPLERPVMIKLFTQGGAVQRQQGDLVFQPTTERDWQVIAVAVNPNGGATMRRLLLESPEG